VFDYCFDGLQFFDFSSSVICAFLKFCMRHVQWTFIIVLQPKGWIVTMCTACVHCTLQYSYNGNKSVT